MSIARQCLKVFLPVLLLSVGTIANAQPKTTEHLLLGSPYGEFCTMCEAFVVCLPQNEAANVNPAEPPKVLPESGNFTLYYFPTRTFWQQIYTIWEWFIVNFMPVNSHGRPLGIYQPDGATLSYQAAETFFSIDPPEITLPDAIINRDDGSWLDSNRQPKGSCYRLPLWETPDAVAKRAPQTPN